MKREDLSPAPVSDRQLRLPDGRRVGYRVYGLPEGKPVYFFHGLPGSRVQAGLVHVQALAAGIALVAFDRPGCGLSDPAVAPTVDSLAADVQDLSDALGHRRFAVVGVSCGGPHALAAARLIGQRVVAVGLLAGIGPMDRPALRSGQLPMLRLMFWLARRWPALIGPLLLPDMLMLRRDPARAVSILARLMTPPDRRLLEASAATRRAFGESLAEAYRQGMGGALRDAARIARFRDADLEGIAVPVHIFQSGQDRNVPPAMGRYLHERIAGAHCHDCPDEGHLSIVLHRFDDCIRLVTTGL